MFLVRFLFDCLLLLDLLRSGEPKVSSSKLSNSEDLFDEVEKWRTLSRNPRCLSDALDADKLLSFIFSSFHVILLPDNLTSKWLLQVPSLLLSLYTFVPTSEQETLWRTMRLARLAHSWSFWKISFICIIFVFFVDCVPIGQPCKFTRILPADLSKLSLALPHRFPLFIFPIHKPSLFFSLPSSSILFLPHSLIPSSSRNQNHSVHHVCS